MEFVKSKAPTAARLFLGLVFTVFGLNGFFNFLPLPELPAEGGTFLGGLAATGYMFPLIKGTEVVTGVLLLAGRYVPLALTLLAPITVNILLFHIVLAPAPGLPLAIIAAQIFLAYVHRDQLSPILQARSEPKQGEQRSIAPSGRTVGAH
jgi:uncharacterized membrane protein YphA (DoxX/SURF4 family)